MTMDGLRPISTNKAVIDTILVLLVASPMVILRYGHRPYRQGFECNDESLQFPFQENTISSELLISAGLLIPICLIIAIECYRFDILPMLFRYYDNKDVSIERSKLMLFRRNLYFFIGHFMLGLTICLSLTDIGKYTMGRLRPFFFAICKPHFAALNCSKYVSEYSCQHGEDAWVEEARQSFPSGHTSFASYSAAFVMIYVQVRLFDEDGSVASSVSRLIQFVVVALAFYTGITRITDRWHHPSDVIGGALLGVSTVYLTTVHIAQFWKMSVLTTRMRFYDKPSLTSFSSNQYSITSDKNAAINFTPIGFSDEKCFDNVVYCNVVE